MKRNTLNIALLSSVIALTGCAGNQFSSDAQIEEALNSKAELITEYKLGPTDVVNISVWRNSDLSISVPVRPDGMISVPLVGDIAASGKTPEQLAQDVADAIAEFVKNPKVSVVVTNMGSYEYIGRVRVTGAVNSAVSVPYREGMTIMDLVLNAGGLNNFAAGNDAGLYRKVGDTVVAIPVKLDDILLKGDISTNYTVNPGDIITIPEKTF
ncbi:XrtA/PEP-CTERM system exopolysaccharide export protein [Alkalimarinus alittae]|uniref:Polysaccharide biosynthesis/export family protein n=1 Tax=Alkalimarinus alittae TaxID=2961619 RepID=A0ABY6N764_9ALTE|nr:XrtA/PEP-CTERM system exopolysaccharide export protein [Alkalimarinus alittae]UZE97961.1 polysaccharide biosynthesis/export family protein [Alkalimarinus alittae]